MPAPPKLPCAGEPSRAIVFVAVGPVGAQVCGAEAGDLPLAAGEGEEEGVVGVEEAF